jgi:hypothetical protein
MSLIGGGGSGAGGAGNPTSGNPAGIGKSLQYVGNKAYAYSGTVSVSSNQVETLLEFHTGTSNFAGFLSIQNGSGSGDDFKYRLNINGEEVSNIHAGTSDIFNQFQFPLDVIFPAFSKIQLTAENLTSTTGRDHTAILTGEIF